MPNDLSIDALLDDFMKHSPRPYLEGAVYRDGEVVRFARGQAPAAAPAVFEIGSVGKTLTTTLFAMLVRDGVVGLTDKVSAYRPEYPFADAITLRDLASHTAGLPANPASVWRMLTAARTVAADFQLADLARFLTGLRRLRRPGRFRYSNLGMALLGTILGERLGMSYEAAVLERICAPLGMTETRIDWRGYPPERLVIGHDARNRPVPPFAWAGMEPAGLWRSTVADMLRFLKAQRGHAGAAWAELARHTTRPVAKVSSDTRVGLGWMLSELPGVGPVAWHAGGTFGQVSIAGWALERDAALVLFTNRVPRFGHSLFPRRSLQHLATRLFGAGP